MALEASIERLLWAQIRKCNDFAFVALAFDVSLTGAVATFATLLLEFQLIVGSAFEMGISEKVG